MDMLKNGSINNYMLLDMARIYTQEEEQEEANLFYDFLVTKNGCLIMELEEQAYNG